MVLIFLFKTLLKKINIEPLNPSSKYCCMLIFFWINILWYTPASGWGGNSSMFWQLCGNLHHWPQFSRHKIIKRQSTEEGRPFTFRINAWIWQSKLNTSNFNQNNYSTSNPTTLFTKNLWGEESRKRKKETFVEFRNGSRSKRFG